MTNDGGHPWYWLVLGVLAVWRVTHLLHVEHGPWGAFFAIRKLAARFGGGSLFDCFYCLSIWVAAPAALWLADGWGARGVIWMALSAGAILIEVRVLGGITSVGTNTPD